MNLHLLRFFKTAFVCIAVVLYCAAFTSSRALSQQLKFQQIEITINKLPLVSARIKALKDGSGLTLTDKNLFIIEDNRYTRAASISLPDGSGFQTVEWYSQLRSTTEVKLMLSDGAGLADTTIKIPSMPFLAFFRFNVQEKRITEYKFKDVAAGQQESVITRIKIMNSDSANPTKSLRIEKIETGTPYFKARWVGGWGLPSALPGNLIPGLPAEIEVTFMPAENKFYNDIVTVYYEGGATDRLAVSGNTLELEEKTVLQLLSPNGGEMLTPCEEFPIRWTGNVAEFPTIIEYSKNNGTTWKEITRAPDSSYSWKVPDDISDSVLVRVRQEFQRSAEGILNAENSDAQALGFSSDGLAFLSGHENGKITEWNVQSFQKVRTLDFNPQGNNIQIAGVGYGKQTTTIGVAYTMSLSGAKTSTLTLFKNNELLPSDEIPLPSTFRLKKMLTDAQGRFFAMVPDLGREILLYDDAGTLSKTLPFDAPIAAATLSSDGSSAIVTLINGEVGFYNLPDFSKRSSIDLSYLPIIQQAALSPDASLLAIATQHPNGLSVSRESEVFIIDIATNNIIRHLISPKSALFSDAKALAFNATGRALVLGYAANPKVSLWSFSKEDDSAPYEDYSDLSLNLSGQLSDVSFGPDGRFAVASALSPLNGNLIYRRFTYPETDKSDGFLRIVPPLATLTTPIFQDTYLGTQNSPQTSDILCNTGEAPIILESAVLKFSKHFKFSTAFLKDTIAPGECLNLPIVFAPRDTGMIYDTLTITTCSRSYTIALEGRSLPRNIGLLADNTNFGELCVGESTERDLAFLKNNDPVPLVINSITVFDALSSAFSIKTPIKDTILQPGESLAVRIQFKPRKLGEDKREIIIRFADQTTITTRLTVLGTGTGADIQAVGAFPFIPEILTRKLLLKNNSPNTVTVTQATLEPQGQFSIITALPFDIPANSDGNIEIVWNGAPITGDVLLKVQTTPCGTEKTILLREFKGSSVVSAPTVEADVHATDVQIPVRFKSNENTAYAGNRFFEAEVLVNPRLFLAESVTSEFGNATFTQEIVAGKRVIKIRVEGDFKTEGIAAVIHGIAGLAETLESPIEFNQASTFFGSAVSVTSQPGLLKITGAGSRRVIQPNITMQIMAVYPNPARENVTLEVDAVENSSAVFEIYNMLGEKLSESSIQLLKGISTTQLNVATLPAGTYRVVLKAAGAITSTSLLNIAR
ncbi:MAG: choice-of-anchor D domain-containing protein [Bacteroidota bacterium]